jgi:nitrogen-specific signal transduction histidine kinase
VFWTWWTALRRIEQKVDRLMAFSQEQLALLAEMDQVTTDIADRMQELMDQLDNYPTPAEEAEIRSKTQALLDRLRQIAHDPDQPVPPEEPPA